MRTLGKLGGGEHNLGVAPVAWSLSLNADGRQDNSFNQCVKYGPKQYCYNDRMALELQPGCSVVVLEIAAVV